MTHEEIRRGYRKHAALAQFHRWYQLYENKAVPIDSQIDILADAVVIKSGLGEAKGHAAYRQRIAQLPATWKNAHFPRNIRVTPQADGDATLTAEVTYLNEGMLPGAAIRKAELTYSTTLTGSETVLPVFTRVEITQNNEGTAETFKDAYAGNRVRSLLHYWFALIEDPARRIEPFKEIFAAGYELNFSSGKISDTKTFEAWLRGPASAVVASTHEVHKLEIEVVSPTEFKMSAEFAWEGLLPNDAPMSARTGHRWLIEDNPNERFARIKSIDVEVLEPFSG